MYWDSIFHCTYILWSNGSVEGSVLQLSHMYIYAPYTTIVLPNIIIKMEAYLCITVSKAMST